MPLLNVDIGGGTTKLALVQGGTVVQTAAIHLGGRLAVVDDEGRLVRLDPAGQRLAAMAGREWSLGQKVSVADMDHVASWMADALATALGGQVRPTDDVRLADVESLWLTEPLHLTDNIKGAMFSGGVGEYVYGREQRDFGDLGRRFGQAVRERIDAGRIPLTLLPAGECIRATALGASEYSVQLSGNTVYISSPRDLLPRKNLQVIRPRLKLTDAVDASDVTAAIRHHFVSFDILEGESEVAIAFRWFGEPSYPRLAALARGIVDAVPRTLAAGRPLFVIVDGDVAQTLGGILKEELQVSSDVLVLDGVRLWDFDYIDLGRVRMPSFTVPVTIKSLVFTADPRIPHTHHHHQTHEHHQR
jgi:ethanolamine utilization protein EutA